MTTSHQLLQCYYYRFNILVALIIFICTINNNKKYIFIENTWTESAAIRVGRDVPKLIDSLTNRHKSLRVFHRDNIDVYIGLIRGLGTCLCT